MIVIPVVEGTEDMVDIDQLVTMFGGKEDRVKMLLNIYASAHDENMETLESSFSSGDTDTLFQVSHKVKGSLSSICASDGAALAADVEHTAKEGSLPSSEAYTALVDELSAIKNQLDEFLH